jgi:CRP-like cAMP-binding protein
MHVKAGRFKNRILAGLPNDELLSISQHLSPVPLPQSHPLLDGASPHGYFLEDGIASCVVVLDNGDSVEVGVIGRDGVVGIPILLGTRSAPGRTFIQIAGSGYRISANKLKQAYETPGTFRDCVQRYMQGFLVQTAQTAACNRLHGIEERLSRWLLTCRDRLDSNSLRLTQDFLATMLGAPRTTVTLAAGMLQRAGMIEYSRGVVEITDRPRLEESCCECYRTVRDEFRRLKLL